MVYLHEYISFLIKISKLASIHLFFQNPNAGTAMIQDAGTRIGQSNTHLYR